MRAACSGSSRTRRRISCSSTWAGTTATKRLPGDLQLSGLFRSGPRNGVTDAEALVALYQAQSSHIRYTREDYDTDIADVRKYSVQEPNTLVLDLSGKTQQLPPALQNE